MTLGRVGDESGASDPGVSAPVMGPPEGGGLNPSGSAEEFFDLAPDLFAEMGLDGRIWKVNSAWRRVLGWQPEAGDNLLLGIVHPEDIGVVELGLKDLKRRDPVIALILRVRNVGGDFRSFSWSAQALADGRVIVVLHDFSDCQRTLNEVREHCRMLETVLEHSAAGYWDWQISQCREYLSDGFKAMLGFSPRELPNTPLAWRSVVVPADLPLVNDAFWDHVASAGERPFVVEIRCRHRSGAVVWMLCTGSVVEWSPSGAPLRMVGCHVDITSRKTDELRRLDAEHALSVAALDERRRLAFHMHDGVGQLLTALAISAKTLAESDVSPATVKEQAGRMVLLVRETHQRIRAITRGLAPEAVTVENLVGAIVRLTEACGAGFQIRCVYDGPDQLPVRDDVVALELYLIIQESILNAVRHGGAGEVAVRVRDKATIIEFRIADNGSGFDTSIMSEAADGMGLQSMEARARKSGGTLEVHSTANGTEIVCVVPKL